MKKSTVVLIVIALIVVLLARGAVSQYNSLVALETNVESRWAQVENQMQRRADLIPNLVATVKGYAEHEEQIFTDIADARARLLGARSPEEQIAANNSLDMALGRLLAISENYPQLKADASFNRLMDELAGTENRIAVERMRYNEAVEVWNRTIRQFPTVILASVLGKQSMAFFAASEAAQQVPQVQF
ncbi:MAG: LemA family protein [Firmicutes bacterium]|nr:LemA family protein [Bacillota bacterium]